MVTRVKYNLTMDRNLAKYTGIKHKLLKNPIQCNGRSNRSKFWLTVKGFKMYANDSFQH